MFSLFRLTIFSTKIACTLGLVYLVTGCSSVSTSVGDVIKFSEKSMGVVASPRKVTKTAAKVKKGGGRRQVGKPYKINGQWFYPKSEPDYNKVGTASWYGDAFHGRLTANGELFDMNSMSAAHTTLPLPSYVEVINLKNGRSVVVRVNDRGPFLHNRIIDLSRRAADLLDFRKNGVAKVRVKYIGPADLKGSDDAKLEASLKINGKPAKGGAFDVASIKVPRAQQRARALKVATPKLRPSSHAALPSGSKLTLREAFRAYQKQDDQLITHSISADASASSDAVVLTPQAPKKTEAKTKETKAAKTKTGETKAVKPLKAADSVLKPLAPNGTERDSAFIKNLATLATEPVAAKPVAKAKPVRKPLAPQKVPVKRKDQATPEAKAVEAKVVPTPAPAPQPVQEAKAAKPEPQTVAVKADPAPKLEKTEPSKADLRIRLASFNTRESADRLLKTLPGSVQASVVEDQGAEGVQYRVQTGTFEDRKSAEAVINQLRMLGILSAEIVTK